ncbi:hypothetical protein HOLleu_19319 [Holothuria leucospilota]|uniref:Uncharacterized protein n=1 Tax=Holothuria leucospilota TaxID=206669 RepID=A0A9Q1BZ24_HOLLE|nr:hypothetical protein HOLleu_19319 [Holothuria leucospilota]
MSYFRNHQTLKTCILRTVKDIEIIPTDLSLEDLILWLTSETALLVANQTSHSRGMVFAQILDQYLG